MRKKYIVSGSITLLLGATGMLLYQYHFFASTKSSSVAAPAPNTTQEVTAPGFETGAAVDAALPATLKPPRTAPAGKKEYRNTQYRFSLFYPQNLTVQETDEGGGAKTIVFENDKTVQGFQIFVVPYGGRQVSAVRFESDEPSGVMQSPGNLVIDGTPATLFFGSNLQLGPTREVWFIRGGYLFEVTSPKSLDTWLGFVMQTWQFI